MVNNSNDKILVLQKLYIFKKQATFIGLLYTNKKLKKI